MLDVTDGAKTGKGPTVSASRHILALILAIASSGCMRTAIDPSAVLSLDPITTASTETTGADAGTIADETAVAQAIAAAGTEAPLPWSNPSTGSSGVITAFSPSSGMDKECVAFETTRHSFDGIALFKGNACPAATGKWLLMEFKRKDR